MSANVMGKIRFLYRNNRMLSGIGLNAKRNLSKNSVPQSESESDPLRKIEKSIDRSAVLKKIEEEFNLSKSQDVTWQENDEIYDYEDEFKGISLERGVTGIFDVEEFVNILKQEKLDNIVAVSVPKELQYVDYLIIATGKSPKQMVAAAEFIRKIAKRRSIETDSIPVIEGRDSKDWIAIDLGNIVLHIFSAKCRRIYDLETLWTVGSKFDDLSNAREEHLEALINFHTQG